MTATDPRAPAPAATIAPAEKPAREMTTLEIYNEQNDLGRRWVDLQKQLEESGGHSGSPGEWMVERMDELDTEWKRRQDRATIAPAEDEAEKPVDFDGLQNDAEKLVGLLKERYPGMLTWNLMLAQRLRAIQKFANAALAEDSAPAAQGGAEEEAGRRYQEPFGRLLYDAEEMRRAFLAGAAWQREQAAPAPGEAKSPRIWYQPQECSKEHCVDKDCPYTHDDGWYVDDKGPFETKEDALAFAAPALTSSERAEVLAVLERMIADYRFKDREENEEPLEDVYAAEHPVMVALRLAARLRSPAPSEDECCEQYLLDEVYCTTCPRAAPLQEPAPRAQTAEGEALEWGENRRRHFQACADRWRRFLSVPEWKPDRSHIEMVISALQRAADAFSALPQSDFAAQEAKNRRGRWEPTDSHARANGLTDAMRNAYHDLFPITPGTETWAMAGIPTADKVWEAMTAASPNPDGVRVSRELESVSTSMLAAGMDAFMTENIKDQSAQGKLCRIYRAMRAAEIDAILGRASS